MPLYEGIGLISEKHAVVLDIGTVYTKAGFAGETGPRCIIPTEITQGGQGDRIVRMSELVTDDEFYKFLIDFIHHLYFKHLLVNPKDRRVVIVESVISPTLLRESIAKVLFMRFEVSNLVFVPGHLMTLFTLGIPSALVVDAGYRETQAFPIYEGILLLNSGDTVPLAAKAIHKSAESLLLKHGTVHFHDRQVSVPEICASLPDSILEDLTVRLCFVTTYERGQQIHAVNQASASTDKLPPPPPAVDYTMDGDKILRIPGLVREQAAEVLFALDNDFQSVATLILDTIIKCPVDVRLTLAENIVIIGGTAMLPGYKARLQSELNSLLKNPHYLSKFAKIKFKFHKPPAKDNYTAWLGAAIFGATDILSSRLLTKDQYLKHGCVPDWASLQFGRNINEDEKAI